MMNTNSFHYQVELVSADSHHIKQVCSETAYLKLHSKQNILYQRNTHILTSQ